VRLDRDLGDVDDDVDVFTVLPTSRARSVPTVRAGLAAGIDRELKDECEREAKTRQRLEGCIPRRVGIMRNPTALWLR
jgi:hypothetical protein